MRSLLEEDDLQEKHVCINIVYTLSLSSKNECFFVHVRVKNVHTKHYLY